MQGFAWNRVPPPLRVGLVVGMLCQLAYLALSVAYPDVDLRHTVHFASVIQALSLACDILNLFGVIELARRNPRAKLLVIAYAAGLAVYVLWMTTALWLSGGDIMLRITVMRWMSFGVRIVFMVGWILVTDSALVMVAVVVTSLVTGPPPLLDSVMSSLHLAGTRVHAVLELVAVAAVIVAAMGVQIVRGVVRPARPSLHAVLAVAAVVAAGVGSVIDLQAEQSMPLVVVMIAALGTLVVGGQLARAHGEAGVWAMQVATVALALAAIVRFSFNASHSVEDEYGLMALAIVVVALAQSVGLIALLVGLTRAAAARGAESERRIASACSILVVLTSVVSLVPHLGDSGSPPLAVGAMALGFCVAAFGLHRAGRVLGESSTELPTATLRA